MDENHLRAELRHWYNHFINGAKALNQRKTIYPVYGFLDGILNTSSIIKSYFDVKYNQDIQAVSADAMHEWMKTNTGIATVVIESIVLATLSTLGNLFSENDPALYQKNIFFTWKYSRELIQAARNAFKAIRTSILTTDMIVLKAFILPCSLIFGTLYVISRMCFLEIQKSRAKMIAQNEDANASRLAILRRPMHEDRLSFNKDDLKSVKAQAVSWYWRTLYLVLKAFNGLIDSLYLFIGIITLSTLGTQTFFYAAVISIFYCAVCIATRAYEEYEQQNRLIMSELALNLTQEAMKLKYHFFELHEISKEIADRPPSSSDRDLALRQGAQIGALDQHLSLFKTIHTNLQQRAILSPLFTILRGAQNGISAYGAILSFAFSTSIICMLVGGTISPVFVIGCIASGIPCLLISVLASWYQHRPDRRTETIKDNQAVIDNLNELMEAVKTGGNRIVRDQKLLAERHIETATSPQEPTVRLIVDVMEVFRSFFSSIGKGKKETDFILNGYQEPDHLGHVQDTPFMTPFICAFSVLSCLVFTLRAYAKYFSNKQTIDAPIDIIPTDGPSTHQLPIFERTPSNLTPSISNSANSLFSPHNATNRQNSHCSNHLPADGRPPTPLSPKFTQPGYTAADLKLCHYTF